MEPIATYSEKRFDGTREFALHADAVVIKGSATLQSDFDARVPLAAIDPEPSTARIRNSTFWAGVAMCVGALVVCEVLVHGFDMEWTKEPTALVAVFALSGAILAMATVKKVEFVRFVSHGGVHVLDMARAGPDSENLDAFVAAVQQQIRVVAAADD